MISNFHLDVTSKGKTTFACAMKIAFEGLIRGKATHYLLHHEAGLVFYWSDPGVTGACELPNEIDVEAATEFAWQWLQSFTPATGQGYAGKIPDIDGSVELEAFKIYTSDPKSENPVNSFTAIVGIKPQWAIYHK